MCWNLDKLIYLIICNEFPTFLWNKMWHFEKKSINNHFKQPCAHKGSSLLGSVQQSSSVREKRHTTRVLYDVLNSVIDFMMMKRCHMHTSLTCIEVWPTCYQWRDITNAILYIGLMTWCHESLHLEKIISWSKLKRAHYVSKPFDLLQITMTFLLHLRKFWSEFEVLNWKISVKNWLSSWWIKFIFL